MLVRGHRRNVFRIFAAVLATAALIYSPPTQAQMRWPRWTVSDGVTNRGQTPPRVGQLSRTGEWISIEVEDGRYLAFERYAAPRELTEPYARSTVTSAFNSIKFTPTFRNALTESQRTILDSIRLTLGESRMLAFATMKEGTPIIGVDYSLFEYLYSYAYLIANFDARGEDWEGFDRSRSLETVTQLWLASEFDRSWRGSRWFHLPTYRWYYGSWSAPSSEQAANTRLSSLLVNFMRPALLHEVCHQVLSHTSAETVDRHRALLAAGNAGTARSEAIARELAADRCAAQHFQRVDSSSDVQGSLLLLMALPMMWSADASAAHPGPIERINQLHRFGVAARQQMVARGAITQSQADKVNAQFRNIADFASQPDALKDLLLSQETGRLPRCPYRPPNKKCS